MDDDFWLAVHTDGKERGADPARCIAAHGFMFPGASLIGAGTTAVGDNGFSAWKTDLAAM